MSPLLLPATGRWHHIAVTWRSWDGESKLYDNGREVGGEEMCAQLFASRDVKADRAMCSLPAWPSPPA